PELVPSSNDAISQRTEDIVGPYELHDFFLFYALRWGFTPSKIFRLCSIAFADKYTLAQIKKWLKVFYTRFFASQYKRSCTPDAVRVGAVSLSPRGDWRMPSDADSALWLKEIDKL
ncbi:MAG: NAD(+) synthase, partial [Clostridia bacterium]